jgi:hypothetical protein
MSQDKPVSDLVGRLEALWKRIDHILPLPSTLHDLDARDYEIYLALAQEIIPTLEALRALEAERDEIDNVSAARYKEMLRLENEVLALQHQLDQRGYWLSEALGHWGALTTSPHAKERIAQIRKEAGL